MSKAWKQEEARVAALFGQRRRPLSGNSMAGIGDSDTMNLDGTRADIFIEVKSWKRMPLIKHIEKARKAAAKEGVPWVLAIHSKGSPNRFAVVDMELLADLWKRAKRAPELSETPILQGKKEEEKKEEALQ